MKITLPKLLRFTRKMILIGFLLGVFGVFFAVWSRWYISKKAAPKIYSKISKIPYNDVGLLLGTVKNLYNGTPNPYFKNRIGTAAELYHAGKVKHLLLSGDNSRKGYNEPEDMKNALMELGVPDTAMTLDFAGFRTFDSMIRGKEVFQLEKFTVISQKFHNQRALFICNHLGIDAVAINVKEVIRYRSYKVELREYAARAKAILDLYVLRTKPKFLGEKITITI